MGAHRRSATEDAAFIRRRDDAKARVPLSPIAGRHTTLKPSGKGEMVGLCPFHNERSPSFYVMDAKGFYHCFGCGAHGDHFDILTQLDGLSFMDALRELEAGTYPEVSPADRAKRKAESEAEQARRIAIAQEIWARAIDPVGTPAEVYARSRGITMRLPDTVRFVMTPRWRDPDTGEVGRDYPAMACALQDQAGDIVGVQCVFLMHGGRRKYERPGGDGKKSKAKLSYGSIVGSAFRIGPPAPNVIVCEGPEDGLTLAQEFPGQSVWVAMGTAMMPSIGFPPEVRAVMLAGDNNAAGREAVEKAGAALAEQGLGVSTMWPADGFKDWNDQLRGIRS